MHLPILQRCEWETALAQIESGLELAMSHHQPDLVAEAHWLKWLLHAHRADNRTAEAAAAAGGGAKGRKTPSEAVETAEAVEKREAVREERMLALKSLHHAIEAQPHRPALVLDLVLERLRAAQEETVDDTANDDTTNEWAPAALEQATAP